MNQRMNRVLIHGLIFSAMVCSLALRPAPAVADAAPLRVCIADSNGGDTGMGGTGHYPADDPGMGGTGHQGDNSNDGMGFGGTGIRAGRIDRATGPVAVRDRHNQKMILAVGDHVCSGDQLTSGLKTDVEIRFVDGGKLDMGPNTTARIDSFIYHENDLRASHNKLSLKDGQIRIASGQIAKSHADNFLLKTPDSEIRVLGTVFTVAYLAKPQGSDDAGTYVGVDAGSIQLQNGQGPLVLQVGEFGYAPRLSAPRRLPGAPAFMNCGPTR